MSSVIKGPDRNVKRTAPFTVEPGFHESSALWFYGNIKLLEGPLAYVPAALGPDDHLPSVLGEIEHSAEKLVLSGSTIVSGIHNDAHRRCAIVPLRWGAPRIIVLSGGFHIHLGENLTEEPFRAARLWRYQFDARTDLVVSRRAPNKSPTFARTNPTVDRLVTGIAEKTYSGLFSTSETIRPFLGDRS